MQLPRPLSRALWFIGIWLASTAALGLIAWAIRSVLL
ncbi:MAG: DUF2474 domain-containing protein [Albidovulum sp.]